MGEEKNNTSVRLCQLSGRFRFVGVLGSSDRSEKPMSDGICGRRVNSVCMYLPLNAVELPVRHPAAPDIQMSRLSVLPSYRISARRPSIDSETSAMSAAHPGRNDDGQGSKLSAHILK